MNVINKLKDRFYKYTQEQRRAIIMSGIFFLICTALGVLLHFAFDLVGGVKWLAPFVPVNESVWEHLKLSFTPYIIILFPIEYYIYGRKVNRFIVGRLIGVLIAMSFSVMEFYTIQGAFGEPAAFVNIIIYCIATLLSYLVPLILWFRAERDSSHETKTISLIALGAIFALFVIFTFLPPTLPLFLDPQGAGYGYYMFM